jgi:hypothetical protein
VLSLRATGVGGGVVADPAGILKSCHADWCSYEYRPGTLVRLSANSSARGHLARWIGGCTGSQPECRLSIVEDTSVTARFTPVQLFTDVDPQEGQVTVSPSGRRCGPGCQAYEYGTAVSIFAQAADGFAFDRWYGFCASLTRDATCGLQLAANAVTAPIFRCASDVCSIGSPIVRDVKTKVTVIGPGSVTVNGKRCSGTCMFVYHRGAIVALTVEPAALFRGWSGQSCRGVGAVCQFLAFKDANNNPPSVTARFSSG